MDYAYIDGTVELLHTTGLPDIDRLLQGCITLCELQFPERISSYALVGSYLDGTAVRSSDIDLLVVFTDAISEGELEAFWRLHYQVNLLSPVLFGCAVFDETELSKGVPAHLRAAKVVYGQNILRGFHGLSTQDTTHRFIKGSLKLMRRFHGGVEVLHFPLSFPDESKDYFGFDFLNSKAQGADYSLKRMVNLVARLAGSLLLIEKQIHPLSKHHSVTRYKESIGGEWAPFVEETYLILNQQWHYKMPEKTENKKKLTHLCKKVLEFENYFLRKLHPLLLDALQSDDEVKRAWGLECQKRLVYGDKVTSAA